MFFNTQEPLWKSDLHCPHLSWTVATLSLDFEAHLLWIQSTCSLSHLASWCIAPSKQSYHRLWTAKNNIISLSWQYQAVSIQLNPEFVNIKTHWYILKLKDDWWPSSQPLSGDPDWWRFREQVQESRRGCRRRCPAQPERLPFRALNKLPTSKA